MHLTTDITENRRVTSKRWLHVAETIAVSQAERMNPKRLYGA